MLPMDVPEPFLKDGTSINCRRMTRQLGKKIRVSAHTPSIYSLHRIVAGRGIRRRKPPPLQVAAPAFEVGGRESEPLSDQRLRNLPSLRHPCGTTHTNKHPAGFGFRQEPRSRGSSSAPNDGRSYRPEFTSELREQGNGKTSAVSHQHGPQGHRNGKGRR